MASRPQASETTLVEYRGRSVRAAAGDLIVKVAPGRSLADVLAALPPAKESRLLLEDASDSGLWYLLRLQRSAETTAALAGAQCVPGVLHVQPNLAYTPSLTPNDPEFGKQWHLLNTLNKEFDVDATAAWDIETGKPSAVIAIVDSGIDTQHPDLVGRFIPGANIDPTRSSRRRAPARSSART